MSLNEVEGGVLVLVNDREWEVLIWLENDIEGGWGWGIGVSE